MSDSDSFINEVTEEVRRDRLYALLRRWGWVPVLMVIAIVGGAAYLEYDRAQRLAASEAFGDALLAALDTADPETRIEGLSGISGDTPEARVIVAFLLSGERAAIEDPDGAAADLRAAAEAPDLSPRYRDLALLRAEMLSPSDPAEARLVLTALATPGAPYAGLAQEQLALLALREGDIDGAVDLFRQIEAAAITTPGLQQRASQLIVAIESGATVIDIRPEDTSANAEPDGETDGAGDASEVADEAGNAGDAGEDSGADPSDQ